MQSAPKALRLQIAVLGRVNAGKSSFVNLVTGQNTSITSEFAGTTTDVVEKAQELTPLGPVLWLDTAGFADDSALGDKRLQKTIQAIERADVAILVCNGDTMGVPEEQILQILAEHKTPVIKIFNKADVHHISSNDGIAVNSTDLSMRDSVLLKLKSALIKVCPDDFLNAQPMLGDLAEPDSTVIMIIPLDYEAPKGRLIMPQVQAIRDCLDHNQNVMVVKESNYKAVLENLKNPPSLVVCDSQIVDKMVAQTPQNIKCTTFSI